MSENTTQNLPHDGFERILKRLDSIDTRLSSFDSRLNSVEVGISALDARLTSLEDKVDRRLQETRPVWEQVLARLGGVEGRLDKVEARLDGFEARLDDFGDELRTSLRRFERQVSLLVEDVHLVRADQRDLDRRVDRLEPKPTP